MGMAEADIIEAEVADAGNWKQAIVMRIINPKSLKGQIFALVVSVIILGAIIVAYSEGDIEYELIDFDQDRARGFAEDLVGLGHPDWKGRMSGSAEEAATAEYILNYFEELGFIPQLNTYEVPMHSINSEPSLRACTPGAVGGFGVVPCSTADIGASIHEFEHRIDYVIQGFSGQSNFNFNNNIAITYLGNGSDNASWEAAAGTIGYVEAGGTIGGNTGIMTKAIEHDLAAIIRVNTDYNCGKIEGDDCVAIFKGTSHEEIMNANGGSMPADLAFIAMSKDAGEQLKSMLIDNSGRIEMQIDVTNDQELTIRAPCGTWFGKTDELLIVGAHHDTVYHGPGAIDDTSGSASVLEMATQMSEIFKEKGDPERTVRFCTWGGEEEGLWGSRAYVEDNQDELASNLRLYINLDMNHADIDLETRGSSLTLFGNDKRDVAHINDIALQYMEERSHVANKYDIRLAVLDGDKGDPDGMPYNSDHGPFVYDRGTSTNGRAVVCYGSGSWEYHTYLDDLTHFNEESLGVSVVIYGTYLNYLAYTQET
jgi:hypothetical protein